MGMPLRDYSRPATKGKLRAPGQRVASDPPMRADLVCVVEGCERDPFCSAPCCRAWYGAVR